MKLRIDKTGILNELSLDCGAIGVTKNAVADNNIIRAYNILMI